MSPTVFRYKGYRFFFFSLEESRIHIHVHAGNCEAKFWIQPEIEVSHNYGFGQKEMNELLNIVKEHKDEIIKAWKEHFGC